MSPNPSHGSRHGGLAACLRPYYAAYRPYPGRFGCFTVAGVPIAKNAAVLEANLALAVSHNTAFGQSYTGQIASDAREHGVNARLSIVF